MPFQVIVVGAGPVGCLAALGLAQRGCHVQIYDSRRDPRPSAPSTSKHDGGRARQLAPVPAVSVELPAGAISSDPAVSNPAATAPAAHRSINLAISTRGLTGLKSVREWKGDKGKGKDLDHDLAELILSEAVPMRARMIHTLPSPKVELASQAYSTAGECINSVDRARLNNLLLDQAIRHPSIQVYFEHKLLRADLEKVMAHDEQNGDLLVELMLEDMSSRPASGRGGLVHKQCDLVIGADGHHSRIRGEMARHVPRMDFSQSYIDNGYVELTIPKRSDHPDASVRDTTPPFKRIHAAPGDGIDDSEFLLDPNHLHIWPRHSFMLIALPNRDGSFTCTLFAPFNIFRRHLSPTQLYGDDGSLLDSDEDIERAEVQPVSMLSFFREHFPDALPLISDEALVRDLSSRKPSNLGMVSVNPYTYKERAILLGDSAHAMVPFYGQGLNCGLEDVRVMLESIDEMLPAQGILASARSPAGVQEQQTRGISLRPDLERSTTSSDSDGTSAGSAVTSVSDARASSTAATTVDESNLDAEESKTVPQKIASDADVGETSSQEANAAASLLEVRLAVRHAFNHYSLHRRADLLAISSLAIQNYDEMSSRVVSTSYLLRAKLDAMLMKTLPKGWWMSLYSMVTFSNQRYSDVTRIRDRQNDVVHKVVEAGFAVASVGLAATSFFGARWAWSRWGRV